jgi:hypothetical protein
MKISKIEYESRNRFAKTCLGFGPVGTIGMPVESWNSWTLFAPNAEDDWLDLLPLEHPDFDKKRIEMGLEYDETGEYLCAGKHPETFLAWMASRLERSEEEVQELLAEYTLFLAEG